VKLTLKTARPGPGAIAWRVDGDKDFLAGNRTPFVIVATEDWQTHEIELPATATIIHLRVHLPPGSSSIREIELKSGSR